MNHGSLVSFARTLVLSSALLALGCGDGEDEAETPNPQSSEIEISGTWNSSFGGTETISSEAWGETTVVDFDNAENVAIIRNPDDDMFNPGKFNRVIWTEPKDGSFYYCWVDFGLDTEAEAKESDATADDSDPDTTGCGGTNPWTKLSAD